MAGNPGRPSTLRDDQPRRRLSRAHRTAKVLRFGKSAERQPPSLPGEPTSKQIPVLARKAPGEITPKVHAGEFMPESSCRRVPAGEFILEVHAGRFILATSTRHRARTARRLLARYTSGAGLVRNLPFPDVLIDVAPEISAS